MTTGIRATYAPPVVLEAWLAGLQVDRAVDARARAGWQRRRSDEDATFVGVLVDLAERDRCVVVETSARAHRGWLKAVGQDFCWLRTARQVDMLITHRAVLSVRPAPSEDRASGDRHVVPFATFAGALSTLVGARLVVSSIDGPSWQGELRSVGRDVAVLELDDRGACYARLASVGAVSVVESG